MDTPQYGPARVEPEASTALEHAACPLCGGAAGPVILQAADTWNPEGPARGVEFKVCRCRTCHAAFTVPRFREVGKHMPFQGSYPFYGRARREGAVLSEAEFRPFHSRARRIQRAHPTPGRILDVGMGDGAFLALMQRRGWSVCGIDNEPDVVAYARRQLGIAECQTADVERGELPAGPFDVVTAWGLLQLMYQPQAFLERMRSVLAPGGVLGIGVSNFGAAGRRLFGRHWHGLGLPRHLVHFEPDSLCRLVEAAGYRILEVGFETPYWIVAESARSVFPLGGILGGISRRAVHAGLSTVGRTRWGETMMLIARAE